MGVDRVSGIGHLGLAYKITLKEDIKCNKLINKFINHAGREKNIGWIVCAL